MIDFTPSARVVSAVLLLAGVGLSALPGQISGGLGDLGEVVRVRNIVKVEDELGGLGTLRQKDGIRLGQIIRTSRDAAIELSFDRDGRLMLWPSTRVKLLPPDPKPERPADCNREVAALIKVRRGDLQVDHDSARDLATLNPRVLEIETRDARICLFGTSIQVHVDPDESIGTGVFVWETGAWVQRISDGKDWVRLEKSQQTFVAKRGKIRVTTVPRFTLPGQRGEGRFNDSPLFDPFVFGGQG